MGEKAWDFISYVIAVIIIAIIIVGATIFGKWFENYFFPKDPEIVVKRDTVVVHDTLRYEVPVPEKEIVVKYIRVPVEVRDTLQRTDTLWVELPRLQREYADSTYRAWVSGYDPALDSIEVYRRTEYIHETQTILLKPRKWSVGIQAGYGAGKDGLTPYLGVGVSYTLFSF